MAGRKKISIVVPVFNEEKCILDFLEKRLIPEVSKIKNYDFEFIFVNDGSTDDTATILKDYIKNSKYKIKLISFSRNFGKEIALSAGLIYSTGNAVLTIDADGQQSPKYIKEFIKEWETGADVVIGVRDHYKKHGLVAKIGSKIFYKLLHVLGNKYTVPGSTDYRLIDRVVVDEYNKLTEHNRIARGLIDWMGFKQKYIKYV